MARDQDGIILEDEVWATTGDKAEPSFARSQGWASQYSVAGGPGPERIVMNQLLFQLFTFAAEVNKRGGALPWDNSVNYRHPALVFGSDNELYESVADSGPDVSGGAVDPISDSSNARWEEALVPAQLASTAAPGTIEIATQAEANALSSQTLAMTPGTLPLASAVQRGLLALATAAEANALSDATKAVTPATIPVSSDSQRGVVELATSAETLIGTDAERAVTPFGLSSVLASTFRSLSIGGFPSTTTFVTPIAARYLFMIYGAGGGGGAASAGVGGTGGATTLSLPGVWNVTALGGPGALGSASSGFGTTPADVSTSGNLTGVSVSGRRGGGNGGGTPASAGTGAGGTGGNGGAAVVSVFLNAGVTLNITIGAGGASGGGQGGVGAPGRIDTFY